MSTQGHAEVEELIMSDLQAEMLSKLVDALTDSARSNAELASEVRQQGQRMDKFLKEVTAMSSAIRDNTSAIGHLVQAREVAERMTEKVAEEKRSTYRKIGLGLWEISKSPLGFVLIGLATWFVVVHLGIAPGSITIP